MSAFKIWKLSLLTFSSAMIAVYLALAFEHGEAIDPSIVIWLSRILIALCRI